MTAPTSVPVAKSIIKRFRLAQNVRVRELARRLEMTAGAISQIERSEASDRINVSTLRKVLHALDAELMITARPASMNHRASRAPFVRRDERVAYELHRALAKRLIDDPDAVLAVVPDNLAKMRTKTHGGHAHEFLDKWERLAKGPLGGIIDVALGTDERSIELRQHSPFAGALTDDERLEAIARASS